METGVIEWLNQTFGAGTFIAISIFLGGIIVTLVTALIRILKAYGKRVKRKTEKHKEEQIFREKMIKMIDEVSELKKTVEGIDEQMKKTTEETDEKMEELSQKLERREIENSAASKRVEEMGEMITLLVESDKDQIKSYITSEYHKWMAKEYIDIYAMATIEGIFTNYRKEKGNSFVDGLVRELRKLPKRTEIENPVMDEQWKNKYMESHVVKIG